MAKFTFAQLVIAKRLRGVRSSANTGSHMTILRIELGKEGNDRVRNITDKGHHGEWLRIAKGGQAGRKMNKHEGPVNRQYQSHSASGDRQMRATIKDIGGKTTNSQFREQEGRVARLEQLRHQTIPLSCDVRMNPEQG